MIFQEVMGIRIFIMLFISSLHATYISGYQASFVDEIFFHSVFFFLAIHDSQSAVLRKPNIYKEIEDVSQLIHFILQNAIIGQS